MKSFRSDEQIIIDFLAQDFLMDQIIRNPTHKHGNILDLAFVSQAEAWDYELLSSKLSDHTPVLLSYSAKYIPCNNFLSEYSPSSFDETAFLQSLNIDSRLPNSPIIGNSNQCFSSLWLSNFQNALSSSLALKRKKRRSLPFFSSSLTVHYLNKLETARRRKAGDLAIRKLENEVSQFIELDKASFLSSAKFLSTNDAFMLLKRLSGRPSLPNKVYWKDTEAETVLDKANLFNSFFKSVYSELSNGSVDFVQETTSDIFLSEICFDSLQLCEFPRDIPTGTIAACDGIPPFIYSSCSELLAPYVHSLERNEFVSMETFEIVSIGSGVPQGSVLGPLLFLVYIDDMLSLPKNSNCYCFADDTKLVCSATNVFGDSQEDINRLYNWSNSNSLKFNAYRSWH